MWNSECGFANPKSEIRNPKLKYGNQEIKTDITGEALPDVSHT